MARTGSKQSMPWFRFYSEVLGDPKLATLTDAQYRVWVNLLCLASMQEERGTISEHSPKLLAALVAHGDQALLQETCAELVDLRIIAVADDGAIAFVNFEKRQYDKPSDKPERVRERVAALRARNKEQSNAHVTRSNAIEAEEDADAEGESDPPSGEIDSIADVDADSQANGNHPHASSTSSGSANPWTPRELQRIGKRIVSRMRLPPSALDGLMLILQQYPCAPPYLESEAGLCAEWCAEKHKKPSLSIFNRWLKRDVQHNQQAPSTSGMNGKHPTTTAETEAGSNGAHQRPSIPGIDIPEDPAEVERRRKRREADAELAKELNLPTIARRVPRQV